jgi:hypothetical protein
MLVYAERLESRENASSSSSHAGALGCCYWRTYAFPLPDSTQWGSGGRGFKSRRPDWLSFVRQHVTRCRTFAFELARSTGTTQERRGAFSSCWHCQSPKASPPARLARIPSAETRGRSSSFTGLKRSGRTAAEPTPTSARTASDRLQLFSANRAGEPGLRPRLRKPQSAMRTVRR